MLCYDMKVRIVQQCTPERKETPQAREKEGRDAAGDERQPVPRQSQMGEMEACYINANWLESGMASIQVIRRNPAGGHAMAIFLVDVSCAGLKDASGRLDVMQEDIDFNLKRARENFELIRIDPEEARKLIGAGVSILAAKRVSPAAALRSLDQPAGRRGGCCRC